MADFIFRISPNIVIGSYTLSRLGQFAREHGSKFMVIMDPILKEVNTAHKILEPLTDRKIDFFVYDEIADGTTTSVIERALSLARQSHIHGIIAAGGGKAIHVGQVLSALYHENHAVYDYIDGAVPTTASLPLICVPSTIREIFMYSPFVPVIDSRNNAVKVFRTQSSVCRLSLIDPNLTATLTENQHTAMVLETLCLATEAYLSQRASFFSDMLSEKAVELLSYALDGTPSLEIVTPAEELLAHGGCMASIAIAASAPGMCTLLGIAINARFRISISLITAILFPHFIEDAGTYKTNRVATLAHLFRVVPREVTGIEAVKTFAENIRHRLGKMNLPVRLKDLGVPIEQLSRAVEDAGQLHMMSSLSKSMTSDDLFTFIKQAY
ncbi:MAG: iron-containing alcohol dehydrogenase [Treponema sp.]|nr:iron-containing alcohol dehydrogenase [Treponema sp.]